MIFLIWVRWKHTYTYRSCFSDRNKVFILYLFSEALGFDVTCLSVWLKSVSCQTAFSDPFSFISWKLFRWNAAAAGHRFLLSYTDTHSLRQVFDISLSIWLQALFQRCSKTSKDMEARHACVLKNEGRNANVTIFSFPSSHERKTYVFETREGGSLIQIVCHPSCIWKNFRFEFGLRM